MKEILRNGPVSIEFQANRLFMAYREGILSEQGIQELKEKTTNVAEQQFHKNLEALAQQLFEKNVDLNNIFAETGDDISLLQLDSSLDSSLDEETQ